ncbi:MAG: glycosyltransferase [Pseudomonadota bacterium]|nr:glycosyltransferase [Pseudomonadota bacterium]
MPTNEPIQAGLISVVMPCFNAAPFVAEAIESVMGQSYGNVELIVVDDGSSDASVDIVNRLRQAHPGRIQFLNQQHAGPYPARNLGAKSARGSFLAFLDADDWWTSDCLEKLHAALEAAPEAALSYCGWQNVGLQEGRDQPYVPPDYELEDKAARFLQAAAPWPIHAALVRREVFGAVGGFDLQMQTCMDYDLWLRIGVARTIKRVPEVMAFYRHHKTGQITSTQWRQARNTWLVKRKFLREHPEQVRHLPPAKIKSLVEGALLKRGYDNFWRRDLVSAQHIFRMSLLKGGWKLKDLAYLLPALLPAPLYQRLVKNRDG